MMTWGLQIAGWHHWKVRHPLRRFTEARETGSQGPDLSVKAIEILNFAMENGPFIDGLPIKNGDFPWLC